MKRFIIAVAGAVLFVSWLEQAFTIMRLSEENENLRNYG